MRASVLSQMDILVSGYLVNKIYLMVNDKETVLNLVLCVTVQLYVSAVHLELLVPEAACSILKYYMLIN